jgi:allantoinase
MTVYRSNRVVLDDGVRPASIRVEEGKVVAVGDFLADFDYGDLVVMPGLVDSHVHVNEPGRTEWEGFATATRAAAAGGSTTIVDMPLNSIPPTVDVAALEAKREAAAGKLAVDVAFWGGLVPGSEPQLGPLSEQGVCGFKAFLVDSGVPEFPSIGLEEMAAALTLLSELERPLLVHAEDPALIRPLDGDPRSYEAFLASRPEDSEGDAVDQVSRIAAGSGARVHVLHVSSAAAVEALSAGPDQLSAETCPHYLTFCAEEIPSGSTAFKCAPPIRSAEHRDALWEGLLAGTLAMVVSDHSPSPPEDKHLDTGDFGKAWGGIGSLQLRLPATWTGALERGIDLMALTRILASAPAELAGLSDSKGSIAPGMDADLVIWDPDGEIEVRAEQLEHRHPTTPYDRMRLRGRVEETILGGMTVFDRGGVHPGRGRMLRRK